MTMQLRWLVDGDQRTLQYRNWVDTTIRTGMPGINYGVPMGQIPPVNGNWQWTEWKDIPEVVENPSPFKGKCSKCGLAFIGTMSYTCTQTDCPTGLGSST